MKQMLYLIIFLIEFTCATHVQSHECTILLVTVNQRETNTILTHLNEKFPHVKTLNINGHVYNHVGKIKSGSNTISICHTISEPGSDSPHGAMQTINIAVRHFTIKSIIQIGIGYGINKEKQKIGDIMVSDKIVPIDHYKISNTGEKILRGGEHRASPLLLKYFKNYAYLHAQGVKFCKYVSGQQLVDNMEHKMHILDSVKEICMGEMEGRGIAVASETYSIPWIIIKGISDWGDGTKKRCSNSEKENQNIASKNCIIFLMNAIRTHEYPFEYTAPLKLKPQIENFYQYTTELNDFNIGVQLYTTEYGDAFRAIKTNLKNKSNVVVTDKHFILQHSDETTDTNNAWYIIYIRLDELLVLTPTTLSLATFESETWRIYINVVCSHQMYQQQIYALFFGTNATWTNALPMLTNDTYVNVKNMRSAYTIIMMIKPYQCKTTVNYLSK